MSSHDPAAAIRCDTKGCPNEPTERVPDSTSPHVVYDLCASCAGGMRALQGVELIDAKNLPTLTFEPLAATTRGQAASMVHHPRCPDPKGRVVCDCGSNVSCSSCGWGRGGTCRCNTRPVSND